MNSVPVIEASPFIRVSVSNQHVRDNLYGQPFDTSLIGNRLGDKPVKMYGSTARRPVLYPVIPMGKSKGII